MALLASIRLDRSSVVPDRSFVCWDRPSILCHRPFIARDRSIIPETDLSFLDHPSGQSPCHFMLPFPSPGPFIHARCGSCSVPTLCASVSTSKDVGWACNPQANARASWLHSPSLGIFVGFFFLAAAASPSPYPLALSHREDLASWRLGNRRVASSGAVCSPMLLQLAMISFMPCILGGLGGFTLMDVLPLSPLCPARCFVL